MERQLPSEYREIIDHLLPDLTDANIDAVVAIAELPEMVRGYEDVKLANVARYRAELERQLQAL